MFPMPRSATARMPRIWCFSEDCLPPPSYPWSSASEQHRQRGSTMSRSDYRTLLNHARKAGLSTREMYTRPGNPSTRSTRQQQPTRRRQRLRVRLHSRGSSHLSTHGLRRAGIDSFAHRRLPLRFVCVQVIHTPILHRKTPYSSRIRHFLHNITPRHTESSNISPVQVSLCVQFLCTFLCTFLCKLRSLCPTLLIHHQSPATFC